MGKRKGNQRDTAFALFGDEEFMRDYYGRRTAFEAYFRLRVEREAKARGLRNVRKRKRHLGP